MKTIEFLIGLFKRDARRYDGVRPIQVHMLRLVFALTFVFVGMGSWSTIIAHEEEWKPLNAVAFCVWAAYSALSFFGILRPLKMLPIVAFQIFYKCLWLSIVAFPLWMNGQLANSPSADMTKDFLWVVLPIVAMPWRYFVSQFFKKTLATQEVLINTPSPVQQ